MSIRIMSQAWGAHLAPSMKLVLMALADISNDAGICWPSVRLLARKCCLSDRAVRRILGDLESAGFIKVEQRFRSDGSQSSNHYQVMPGTGEGDNSAGGPAADAPGGGSPEQADDDNAVIPLNHHQEPPVMPQQQGGCSGNSDLPFPTSLSEAERKEARTRLNGLPFEVAQELLFELAGRISVNPVRNPLRYLTALVASVRDGSFKPDLAPRARERHARSQALAESIARQDAERAAAPLPVNLDALPPRLREIMQKHVKRAAEVVPTSDTKAAN